jgi:hypothetical protein
MYHNDPKRLSELANTAQAATQKADALGQELLAITMAPQIAEELRDWKFERDAKQQDLHNREYELEMQFQQQHPEDRGGLNDIIQEWAIRYEDAEKESDDQLKGLMATADFTRSELLKRVPMQYPDDKKDFQSRPREDAARYLENLAKRVPPPSK